MDEKKIMKEIKSMEWFLGPWETEVWRTVIEGITDYKQKTFVKGFLDAHSHLDRAFTFSPEYLPLSIHLNEVADYPLGVKQDMIGQLHNGKAYREDSLKERMTIQIDRAIHVGTRELWAITDTTPDIGLRAFNVAQELKKEYADQINLKVGCYPVFGLKNPSINRDRLDVLEEAALTADFTVGLPEKDRPADRIGFKGHVNILLEIGVTYNQEIHLHVDQANTSFTTDTFQAIECLEGLVPEKLNYYMRGDRPKLWMVHVIGPSCYDPKTFSYLIHKLLEYNIGVIVCPRAALSMRDLRCEKTPTHNSIARVIEMLKAGVKMSFGTDNINDIFVPSGSGLILSELDILWDAVRNYNLHILAKVGMGINLDNSDREILSRALYEKRKAIEMHQNFVADELSNGKLFTY